MNGAICVSRFEIKSKIVLVKLPTVGLNVELGKTNPNSLTKACKSWMSPVGRLIPGKGIWIGAKGKPKFGIGIPGTTGGFMEFESGEQGGILSYMSYFGTTIQMILFRTIWS